MLKNKRRCDILLVSFGKGEKAVLKKILGEAPFDAELDGEITVSPQKKSYRSLVLKNISEYDLPLSCSIKTASFAEVDKPFFDITVPAEGNTSENISFSVPCDSRLFGGEKVWTLEICDRIFDSRTEYEIPMKCEMSYKCSDDKKDSFVPSEQVIFSNKGVFFANAGEIVSLQIPCLEEISLVLHIISGEIAGYKDRDIICLAKGLNRLSFEMIKDGSFEFQNTVNEETAFPDTINPKYFIQEN